MHALTREFLVACETHSADRLRAVLAAGFDARTPIDGVSPVTTLVEMYYRSNAFAECLALLLAAGGTLDGGSGVASVWSRRVGCGRPPASEDSP